MPVAATATGCFVIDDDYSSIGYRAKQKKDGHAAHPSFISDHCLQRLKSDYLIGLEPVQVAKRIFYGTSGGLSRFSNGSGTLVLMNGAGEVRVGGGLDRTLASEASAVTSSAG